MSFARMRRMQFASQVSFVYSFMRRPSPSSAHVPGILRPEACVPHPTGLWLKVEKGAGVSQWVYE